MPETAVKTRFAPSPTGYLHVGNARTALFNYFLARQTGGKFVLRIEDTDAARCRPEFLAATLEDLRWLGMDWDEGPEKNGGAGPYKQSERAEIYSGLFSQLADAGHTYECYCTPEELKAARKTQIRRGEAPRYPGTCRDLTAQDRRRHAAGRPASLRYRVAEEGSIGFTDLVRGPVEFSLADIGDFVIRRADGSPNFLFGNAVDDAVMGVDQVIRGEDHVSNTPRQLLVLKALGRRAPGYGHIPLLIGDDNRPLSKREGGTGVRDLRMQGYCPDAIWNYLGRLGHHYPTDETLSTEQLTRRFSLAHVTRSPAHYDAAQLAHWQKDVVHQASATQLADWLGETALDVVPEKAMGTFLATVQPNLEFPSDASDWAHIVFDAPAKLTDDDEGLLQDAGSEFFTALLEALDTHGPDVAAIVGDVRERTGRKGKSIYMPLRLALTGRRDGPELAPLLRLIPLELVRARIAARTE